MEFENRILEILMKETTSELSSEEHSVLMEFSGKSDRNSAFLAENRVILNHLPNFEDDAASMFDVDSALIRVKSQIEDPTAKIRTLSPKKSKVSIFNYQKWAAAVLFLVGMGSLTYTFLGISSPCERYTAVNQVENILLPDGSEVVLNKNSTLELEKHYRASEIRGMMLKGEAYFKVKHDANHPFIVKTGDIQVEVLGTQFNVDTEGGLENTTVFVKKGKVKVTSANSRTKVLLTAGESATFNTDTHALLKDQEQQRNATSWMDNKLRFENTALSQVLLDIEKQYDINIELKNDALIDCKYTSIFNGAKADEVLETLSAVFDMQLMKDGDKTFELTGGNCN